MSIVTQPHHAVCRAAPLTIGRDPWNAIVADDPKASRYHAILRPAPDGSWTLTDRSANGTTVNGEHVHRRAVAIHEGDTVSIGTCTYQVVGGSLLESTSERPVVLAASGVSVFDDLGRLLVRDVDLALRQGQLLAVVGCSGAGKSTLLRTMAGVQPPDHGSISVADGCRIGFVPQDNVLHTSLSVRAALRFGAKLRFPPTVTRKEISARVDEVIEQLGLSARADHRIDVLSGGERKRVNVGLELLTKPSLLFVDEPTSGLDPGSEAAVISQLHQLAADGCTVVVVTHATHCLDVFDQVLVLSKHGRVAYVGPPSLRDEVFGTESWPMIFASLEAGESEQTHGAAPRRRRLIGHQSAPAPSTRSENAASRQYATLINRQLAVLLSDRKHLMLLMAQAPIISVLIMVLSRGALGDQRVMGRSHASVALLSIVLGIAYLGASNAVREIVKEKAIFEREKMVGLSSWAYVGSKVTVLSLFVVVQSVCLVLIGLALDGRHTTAVLSIGSDTSELLATTLLTGCAAMGVGLLISALATNVDKATASLPVVLLAMYLLSGGPSDPSATPVLREISHVNVAKWGLSGIAATTDLNRLNGCTDLRPNDASPKAEQIGGPCRPLWAHRADSVLTAWSALFSITVGTLLATGRLISRRGRGYARRR